MNARKEPKTAVLARKLLAGDRRALAKAITLAESTRPADMEEAGRLFAKILPRTGKSIRIGLSGPPGAGKSTFIEAFGKFLTARGHKVAVLAVDPTSRRSGGSILGDKTRMPELARDGNAFIRPSPSGKTLGGVAQRTREAMLLCEAAGFGVVIIETVGVGQSETAVADMTDMFVLLVGPGAGDELQGVKRGVMELADLVLVNKADRDLVAAARRAHAEIQAALRLLAPRSPAWTPGSREISALERRGLDAVWADVEAFVKAMHGSGEWCARRAASAESWFMDEVRHGLEAALLGKHAAELRAAARKAASGAALPSAEARRLVARFLGKARGRTRA